MSCRKCWLVLIFLILEVPDLCLDWDFFIESVQSESTFFKDYPGVLWSILAFAIVGTIFFILELVNLYREVFLDKPCVYLDMASMLSTWLEDVSQIVLATIVALYMSEVITLVQYAKAGFSIFEVGVRIIMTIFYIHRKKHLREMKRQVGISGFSLAGGIIILGCAIFILVELHNDNFSLYS